MKTVQQLLICTLLAAVTALAACAIVLVEATRRTVASIPGEVKATRSAVLSEVAAARCDLTAQMAGARRDLLALTDRQATALRTDTLAEVVAIRQTADRRWGDTLTRVDTALGKIDEVRGDLRPVLANSAALTADARDSWDDLYWDVKASLASTTVAANNIGQMSMEIRGAVPGMVSTWSGIGANVESVTGNVKRLTTPKWYDRAIGYTLSVGALYRDLNPGYNLASGIRGLFTKHQEQ